MFYSAACFFPLWPLDGVDSMRKGRLEGPKLTVRRISHPKESGYVLKWYGIILTHSLDFSF